MTYHVKDDIDIQSTSAAVWVATALLHRENKEKKDFHIEEIFDKVRSEKLINNADSTIRVYISVHCVANGKPNPTKHKKLFRTFPGWYRLYRDGDDYNPLRERGKSAPSPSEVPAKYRGLIEWYNAEYNVGIKSKKLKSASLTFTTVEEGNRVKVPSNILERLDLKQDDYITFIETASGEIVLKKARLQVE